MLRAERAMSVNRRLSLGLIAVVGVVLTSVPLRGQGGNGDDDGMVARWKFDDEHVVDRVLRPAHGGPTGRIVGATKSEAGGLGLRFDGKTASVVLDGDVKTDRHPMPMTAVSIEAWVTIDAPLSYGGIVGFIQDNGPAERGWLLGYRGSQFCFALSTNGADDGDGRLTYLTGKSSFEKGRWFHVVGTYDGTTQRLYVDGRLESESKTFSRARFSTRTRRSTKSARITIATSTFAWRARYSRWPSSAARWMRRRWSDVFVRARVECRGRGDRRSRRSCVSNQKASRGFRGRQSRR